MVNNFGIRMECGMFPKKFKYGIWESRFCFDNDITLVIYKNGAQFWYKNEEYHRDDDKPAIFWSCGTKSWYKNGTEYKNSES